MRLSAPRLGLLTACLLFAAVPASGARAADSESDVGKRLEDVQERIARDSEKTDALRANAARQAEELAHLRAEMRAAAAAAQAHEAALTSIEQELGLLAEENAAKQDALTRRRAQLGNTLAALQRLSLRPPALLLVSPGDPNDLVRSGLMLRSAVPELEHRAAALRRDIAELAALRTEIETKGVELEAAGKALERESRRLRDLAAAKNRVLQQTRTAADAAANRVAALREQAQTLSELLARLQEPAQVPPQSAAVPVPPERAALPEAPPISAARGRLAPPAQGKILRGFGARTEFGGTARGVTWQVRPAAAVIAPWDGRIVFAGPFRSFGRILIIDHGEGYHSLLAGLGRIDAQAGQWVLAGEPVGTAGASVQNGGASGGGRDSRPAGRGGESELYVELRRDGQPINPLPWLAASTDRTRG